jgi:L-amino acid N-acyltransferase YncA/putative methionine-R-sulfoxide reductase with GAF domain
MEQRQHDARVQLQRTLSAILASGSDRKTCIARAASAIRDLGAYRWVGIYDVTSRSVAIIAFDGPGPPAYTEFTKDRGLTGDVIRTGDAVVVEDVTRDPRYLTAFDSTRSEAIVPIFDGEQLVGTIDVESERVAAFAAPDVTLLDAAADALAPLFRSASIRLATHDDAPAFAAIYGPIVEGTAISFEDVAPSVDEMARRIRVVMQRTPWLTAHAGDEVLGYAYASAHRERAAYRWCVDVSAYVAPNGRERGIGRRLYEALMRVLVRQGFYRAYAGIALPNEPSIALHRSVGFTEVGVYRKVGYKLGRWHDVSWWERSLQDGEPSADPIPLCEVAQAQRIAAALRST